jgi:3-polyprenyl-4-hydroxybenzoate decarboxylase
MNVERDGMHIVKLTNNIGSRLHAELEAGIDPHVIACAVAMALARVREHSLNGLVMTDHAMRLYHDPPEGNQIPPTPY